MAFQDAIDAAVNCFQRGGAAVFIEECIVLGGGGIAEKLHQTDHAAVIERDMPVVLIAEREILWPSAVGILGFKDVVEARQKRFLIASVAYRSESVGQETTKNAMKVMQIRRTMVEYRLYDKSRCAQTREAFHGDQRTTLLVDIAAYPLISNERWRAVLGDFQNDLDLLTRFVRWTAPLLVRTADRIDSQLRQNFRRIVQRLSIERTLLADVPWIGNPLNPFRQCQWKRPGDAESPSSAPSPAIAAVDVKK